MVDYMVINATDAELTNVNIGGVDVPKRSIGNTITLTDAEVAALCVQAGVAVIKDTSTRQNMREIGKGLKYLKVNAL